MASMIDLDYDWEAERKARIAHRRRLWFAKWFALFAYALLVIGFVAAIAVLAWIGINQKRFERAAYNEGRYGVSREVALKLADQGVGMCAEEILDAGASEKQQYTTTKPSAETDGVLLTIERRGASSAANAQQFVCTSAAGRDGQPYRGRACRSATAACDGEVR